MRLTAAEKTAFTRFAQSLGQSPSALLRRMTREAVTGEPDLFVDQLPVLADAANQLAAVGRNLNQIARAVNSGEVIADPVSRAEMASLETAVGDLKSEVRRLIQNTRSRTVELSGEK